MGSAPSGLAPAAARFRWSALRGPCRRRLAAGLGLVLVAALHGGWAARQFGTRGADRATFDAALVDMADRWTRPDRGLAVIRPQNDRELYLLSVITDQQDLISGLTVLALRAILAVTIGGLGMVLLTAGSTEWEIRSGEGRQPGLTGPPGAAPPSATTAAATE